MASTKGKSPPVDLAKTRAKWDGIDGKVAAINERNSTIERLRVLNGEDEEIIEKEKWEVARDLWTACNVDWIPQVEIVKLTKRSKTTVSKWIKVWERRDDFSERGVSFADAAEEVKFGEADKTTRWHTAQRYRANSFIRSAPTEEKAKFAAKLLDDAGVQEELAKAPERGGKVAAKLLATNQQKADLAADLLEDDNVARAVQKVLKKRDAPKIAAARAAQKAEQEARLEASYTDQQRAAMGRNGDRAQAEAIAQIATEQDEPDDNAVYTDENGDVYNHNYDKEDPDSPFIKTAEGSFVNWHNEMACDTQKPRDIIDGIEHGIENINGPAYTLGDKDKRRLRTILTKGLEALK